MSNPTKCGWCNAWYYGNSCENPDCKSNKPTWRKWKCNYCHTWNYRDKEKCENCGTEYAGNETWNY